MRRSRGIPRPPQRRDAHDGLAYAVFCPEGPPAGGVIVLHGAGSSKESHFDFARAARAHGLAALVFDQRGHGESAGPLADGAIEDIAAMAHLLGVRPLALRGSSMGGYLALVSARRLAADAVVAVCPADGQLLLTGLRRGRHPPFAVDHERFSAFLEAHDVLEAVSELTSPLLLMHAEGDEVVPAALSTELLAHSASATKRLLRLPGGHHRSVQHDPELQAESLRFIVRAFRAGSSSAGSSSAGSSSAG